VGREDTVGDDDGEMLVDLDMGGYEQKTREQKVQVF
jgi:hypothetical protein